jgi:hypothetical protein
MDRPPTKSDVMQHRTCHLLDKHTACTCRTPRHESWRAQRRYAASIGALMAQTSNLSTENSKLAVENSPLAVQCSAGVTATATSDALLQDGSGWQCTRTHARPHAHARAPMRTRQDWPPPVSTPSTQCEYSKYPVCVVRVPQCEHFQYPRVSFERTPMSTQSTHFD